MDNLTKEDLADMIDHTVLKPVATPEMIKKLCGEAKEFKFKAVCVNPSFVKLAKAELEGSEVLICSVVGFPLGCIPSDVKANETKRAVEDGADEIDMVLNLGMFKSGDFDYTRNDIKSVVEAAKPAHVKVILETGYLEDEEIIHACQISKEAGAAFVKTSTGFGPMGATPEHVKLMRDTVGPDIGVKAAGGIKNIEDAFAMITAGANRLGCSAGIAIYKGME